MIALKPYPIEQVLNDDSDIVSSDGNSPIIELVIKGLPKIILLEIKLEGKSGYSLCKELRHSDINADIVELCHKLKRQALAPI